MIDARELTPSTEVTVLINTAERWKRFCAAQDEARARMGIMPGLDYYEPRLREVWQRARRTPAYEHLCSYSAAAFQEIRSTSKDELKATPWNYVVPQTGPGAKYYETTGTTGRVTPTPRLADDIILNVVSVGEAWRRVLSPDDRVIILLPSDVVPVADLVAGVCEYLGIPHTRAYPFTTGICDWDRIIGIWRHLRPTAMFLAPGVAMQFTRLAKRRGVLPELREPVQRMMLLGEVNTAPLRRRLGQWWDAVAHDASYGSTETGTLAATCTFGQLHLLPCANYFELATDAGLVGLPAEGRGRLVVTPLNLFARPVLRLDTGDDVTIGGDCDCGDAAPIVSVGGRGTDMVHVRGTSMSVRAIEEVVYSASSATGYLLEIGADGGYARLVLERDIDWDRAAEPGLARRVLAATSDALGLSWDDVVFVNSLPETTKAGASQKSWKRSNVRVLDGTQQ
ncbi:hypothetical protein GCM10012284_04660 [Mangrovihabitans endophyticus]|uniref:Phenylacetate-CoA ligase n=2 Tax=Mangrovihabitans endophyticus TaxID=1751298 RepID=A0A8J3BSD1_9ACTN|nr:hypothetical protein GCM10012284_04660 [Mangrovihabitans endophyticus]